MQAYSDFRVNCYPQTVIDLVTCFCKKGCIAYCFICKPLMMFCTLLCKCKWMIRVVIQQLLERQYKLVETCTKSVEIGTAPFTSSAFAMAIIGLKGENRTY